jgi:hypothetical protein
MRIGSRRGVTLACALILAGLAATTARADWFHHTVEKEVLAMDYRTGGVMMAPPIPYGEYTKDYVGCIHGALGAAKGAAHGLLGKLCSLCGMPGCRQCGGMGHNGQGACGGCGGDGCSNCDGHGKLTTCGMLHGGGGGMGLGNGHAGHNHGPAQGAIAPMAAAGRGGKGLLGGLFGGHKHKGGVAPGGCASCGIAGGVTATAQGVVQPAPQGAVAPMNACGACGGNGRLGNGTCGPCGGKGLLGGLGHGHGGGLKGCTTCGGQGRLGNGTCGPCGGKGLLAGGGNGACDSPCGACGGRGLGAHGGACGSCGGSGCLKGALNGVAGAAHHVAGTAHGLVGKLFHKGEIEYFVGPGGPVPITPGYVPYVVPTRSPRDFFAFPPMSERADPYAGGYSSAGVDRTTYNVAPVAPAPAAAVAPRADVGVTPPPPAPGVEDAGAIEMNP